MKEGPSIGKQACQAGDRGLQRAPEMKSSHQVAKACSLGDRAGVGVGMLEGSDGWAASSSVRRAASLSGRPSQAREKGPQARHVPDLGRFVADLNRVTLWLWFEKSLSSEEVRVEEKERKECLQWRKRGSLAS